MEVTVPSDSFRRKLDSAYNELAKNSNIPGFRPGKAPRNIINRYYNKEKIHDAAVEETIEEAFWPAVKDKELILAGKPRIEPLPWKDGEDFKFVAVLEAVPPIPEVAYENIEILLPEREITDETIDEEIRKLSIRFGEATEIKDRPASNGDFVTLIFSGEVPDQTVETPEGEKVWHYDEQEMEIELGRGKALPGLEEALAGMELEELKEFDLTLPDDFADARVRSKILKAKARITKIREIKPAVIDDETVKKHFGEKGVADVGALRDKIREEIENANKSLDENSKKEQIYEFLSRMTDFPLPEGMVRGEFINSLDRILKALSDTGTDIEELMKPENERGVRIRKRTRLEAERVARVDLLLGDIARRESIGVQSDEIANYIMMMAYRQGFKEQDLKLLLKDPGFVEGTRNEILQKKVMIFLSSKVKEKKISREDFIAFVENLRKENEETTKSALESLEDPIKALETDYLHEFIHKDHPDTTDIDSNDSNENTEKSGVE